MKRKRSKNPSTSKKDKIDMYRYRVVNHTADIGIQVFGKTTAELFVNGAYAFFDVMTDLKRVQATMDTAITAVGADLDELWVNYLRECLYRYTGEGLLLSDVSLITMDEGCVTARMGGEEFNPMRHRIKKEIKAVTYHKASVGRTGRGWMGTVILDV